jgi:hypothetical protein
MFVRRFRDREVVGVFIVFVRRFSVSNKHRP